jgi:hypothetical protein
MRLCGSYFIRFTNHQIICSCYSLYSKEDGFMSVLSLKEQNSVIYRENRVTELNQKNILCAISITLHIQGTPSTHCLKTFSKIKSVHKKIDDV